MKRLLEERQRLLEAILGSPHADAPNLSDLVKLFLEENVEDPSIIRVERATWDGYYKSQRDYSSYDVTLNGINIAKVLNTFAMVQLKWSTRLGVADEVAEQYVNAAEPEFFEKFWAHIAAVDAKIDCPGWSILTKPPPPVGPSSTFFVIGDTDPYPAFKDDKN